MEGNNEQNKFKFFNCSGFVKGYGIVKILLIILVVIVFGKLAFCGNCYKNDVQKDTITVSGKGEINVKPDIATVSFSITEENMDVAKASDAVNTKIAKVVENLKANGVDEKDIKTTDYNIYPRYDYIKSDIYVSYSSKQVLAGYDVTQTIEVKIRDLEKAGKIITDLGTLKVTNMGGLNFTNDKYDDLVKEARDEAIKQARSEAKKLAKSLDVRLVKIVGYSEGGNNYALYDSRMSGSAASMKTMAAEAVIPTGENKITSNVSITYEIR